MRKRCPRHWTPPAWSGAREAIRQASRIGSARARPTMMASTPPKAAPSRTARRIGSRPPLPGRAFSASGGKSRRTATRWSSRSMGLNKAGSTTWWIGARNNSSSRPAPTRSGGLTARTPSPTAPTGMPPGLTRSPLPTPPGRFSSSNPTAARRCGAKRYRSTSPSAASNLSRINGARIILRWLARPTRASRSITPAPITARSTRWL